MNPDDNVIYSYTSEQAAEDGVLVPVTKRDAVTRALWEYLVQKAPKTSQPPCAWPVEMMGWFKAGKITRDAALKLIAEYGATEAQARLERMAADNKALALARGLIGRDAATAKRVYEQNIGGGIHKVIVAETDAEIVGLIDWEIPAGAKQRSRVIWMIPNELGGVTVMFPEDY